MKISSIVLSRVLAFIDTIDLSPVGGVDARGFVRETAEQFHFQKYPQTLDEFDTQKGMEFVSGRLGKKTISKFVIWNNILVVESRFTTTETQEMLQEMLLWGTEKFKLTYSPEMIQHYAYVSDLSFYSDAPLLSIDPLLRRIAERIGSSLTKIWQEPILYEPFDLKIGHDPLARKWGIAPFQITRRAEHRFSENKYFSEAPLPTDEHIALLEEYEKEIVARAQ